MNESQKRQVDALLEKLSSLSLEQIRALRADPQYQNNPFDTFQEMSDAAEEAMKEEIFEMVLEKYLKKTPEEWAVIDNDESLSPNLFDMLQEMSDIIENDPEFQKWLKEQENNNVSQS